MKVALVGPSSKNDAFRGIGVHTNELLKALKRYKDLKLLSGFSQEADVLHFIKFRPFFRDLPFFKNAKQKWILTIHDLIPLIYPEVYKPGLKGKINFLINKFLIKRNVDAIITISETSKKDICRFLGVSPSKVHVVYLASRKVFKKSNLGYRKSEIVKRYGLPDRFVLYVGDVNYNKNIPLLIEASRLAKISLVIVGKEAREVETGGLDLRNLRGLTDYVRFLFGLPHPELKHYQLLSNHFRNNPNIFRLGFVPDKDLAVIYKLASVYCQPSLYEGFGLPVLEAFSSGCPAVLSKTQALVEIGGAGALFASPKNPKEFARKIKDILNDDVLRKQLINTAKIIAENFSWQKAALETLSVYKSLIEND
jgi:glycosyltransferase involved in cell wall biosynthesis